MKKWGIGRSLVSPHNGNQHISQDIKKERMDLIMCMTVEEMNNAMEEIKSLKLLKEETEEVIRALEMKVIEFLEETEGCQTVNKEGNPVLKFIGSSRKATYSEQTRETVDKAEVKELLSEEDYQKVSKVSRYKVLRIS